MGAFLHFVQSFFKCKTVLEREFSVFLKEIAFPWIEESDLSFLLLPLFYFSSLLHRGRQGLGQVRASWQGAAWTVAWKCRLWSITCQSQPEKLRAPLMASPML